jgi:uncharacterized protein YnzC (UPF0291/DUF896 family)
MNKYLEYGIIFLSGAAVGGVISWFVAKRKFENLADKEIAEAREFYINRIREQYGVDVRAKKSIAEESAKEKPKEIDRVDYLAKKQDTEEIDYTTYYQNKKSVSAAVDLAEMEYPVEGDENEEESYNYRDGKRDSEELNSRTDIELISPESFAVDYSQFDKETLFYWTEDETLSDERDEIIDDADRIVGDCLAQSGIMYDDTPKAVIYVRNYDLGTDYEIQKIVGSFKENVVD